MSKFAPDQHVDYDGWLQWRYDHIGSSDAPVILGLVKYKSRDELWYEKKNRITADVPDLEKLNWCYRLESCAADIYQGLTGYRVQTARGQEHPDHPAISANVDRLVTMPDGTQRALEIKTCNPGLFRDVLLDGPLQSWVVQSMQGAAVLGLQHYSVFAIDRDTGKHAIWDFEFDHEIWQGIERAVLAFHESLAGEAPPSDQRPEVAIPSTSGLLVHIDNRDLGDAVVAYENAALDMDVATATKQEARNRISEIMQEAGADVTEWQGRRIYRRIQAPRKTFDARLFSVAHPTIDLERFYRVGKPYVVVRVGEPRRDDE